MKSKIKTLRKDEFFSEVSALANYCDKKLVESVYYGMIKVISRQLKTTGKVKMPDWGDFYIQNMAPRMTLDVNTGKMHNIGMKKCVKFDPDVKVKAYFRGLE